MLVYTGTHGTLSQRYILPGETSTPSEAKLQPTGPTFLTNGDTFIRSLSQLKIHHERILVLGSQNIHTSALTL